MSEEQSFGGKVWKKLSALDVSQHTEAKQGFTYLSWSWAWGELMNAYPESEFWNQPPTYHPDRTCTVSVTVMVKDGEHSLTRTMSLPVLNANKPIQEPNAFQLNTAYMRCLVKCLALFGLGLNIYAGEDVPMYSAEAEQEAMSTMVELLPEGVQAKFYKACGSVDGSPIDISAVPEEKRRPALKWLKSALEKVA